MNCLFHSEAEAKSCCSVCGAPICDSCTITYNNAIMCPKCYKTVALNNRDSWQRTASSYIYGFFGGLICFVGGLLLATLVGEWWSILLGIFLMTVPAFDEIRNDNTVVIDSGCSFILRKIFRVILCLVLAPIFILKNLIMYFPANKNFKLWSEEIEKIDNYLSSAA